MYSNGVKQAEGEAELPYILPAESKNVTIDLAKAVKKIDWETDDVRLNLSLVLKTACDWLRQVTRWQPNTDAEGQPDAGGAHRGERRTQAGTHGDEAVIRVENNAVLAVWDVKSATLRQLAYAGRTVLQAKDSLAAANFQAFRAPTDNDKSFGNWLAKDWQKNLMHAPKVEALACTGRALDDGSVEVETAQRYVYLAGSILVNSIYKVYGDGTIDLSQTYTPEGDLPELPRLGVSFVADAACDNVEWYGYGPMETYPDRHRSATINWWRAKAGDQYTHYPRPQDSGNLEVGGCHPSDGRDRTRHQRVGTGQTLLRFGTALFGDGHLSRLARQRPAALRRGLPEHRHCRIGLGQQQLRTGAY